MDTTEEVQIVPMTEQEARAAVESIKADLDSAGKKILDLKRREGWKVLGYQSWRQCATNEFGKCTSRVYQLIQIEETREFILRNSINSSIESISVGAMGPLTQLREEPELLKESWQEAKEIGNGKPTAEQVKRAVDTVLASQGFPISSPELNGALPGQTTFIREPEEDDEPEAVADSPPRGRGVTQA